VSLDDEMRAQRALFHYLTEWGVEDAPQRSRKFIDELVGCGWQMAPKWEHRPSPPKGDEACQLCGRHLDRCVCETAPQVRPIPASERMAERAAELKRIKAGATADHCSHGVKPEHCIEHRTDTTSDTTEETS
jgi:hypothetical protein